jgi:hypothetical protein|eukprot:scaffold14582_cov172-Alexandrium_tamarense.AAC.2
MDMKCSRSRPQCPLHRTQLCALLSPSTKEPPLAFVAGSVSINLFVLTIPSIASELDQISSLAFPNTTTSTSCVLTAAPTTTKQTANSPTMTTAIPPIDQIDYETYHGTKGSWTPTILLLLLLTVRYLMQNSIKFQRFIGNQKIYWRKRLGYRDESKYHMGVGDGANMKLKRQG